MQEETKDDKEVGPKDFKNFVDFSYGCCGLLLLFFLFSLGAALQIMPSLWLTQWIEGDQEDSKYPLVFGLLILALVLTNMIRATTVLAVVLKSASNLHDAMVRRVLRADILFFDSNPIGRIVTRFSKELMMFDTVVPPTIMLTFQGFFRIVTVVITIAIINPYILIVVFVGSLMMYYIMKRGSKVMIESQRKESIARGPLNGNFAMLVNGLVSVRANDRIDYFREAFDKDMQMSANSTFSYVIANRWIGIRLDIICSIFITSICIFSILMKGQIAKEQLILTLQISIDVISLFSISFRMYAELENTMTSSQSMIAYTKLDIEDLLEQPGDEALEKRLWPSNGDIEFEDVTMRYRKELDPAVYKLSFKAQPGMIVGIVGKTGSGKSSILQTLFRLVEVQSGKITIDGNDIRDVGLHLLRKSIALIPQSPFLIQGTIRENLDPFNECT